MMEDNMRKRMYLYVWVGYYAVQLLEQGIGNRVVGLKQGEVVDVDIQEALKMKKEFPADLYKMADEISF